MDIGHAALVVIDMQNGFVNRHSRHAVAAVTDLVTRWSASGLPVVFTRYFNHPGSPYEQFFGWHRLQGPPETDIVAELTDHAADAYRVLDKPGYTFLTAEAAALVRAAGWTDLVFCGVATESCVLKSAADAFEQGYTPWIITDACASDAGPAVHDAGLLVARRLVGEGQLITADLVTRHLDAHDRATVPDRNGPSRRTDTDLIVVGGGPAGCAAARMAASVGMRSVLVEQDTLCHTLRRIPVLANVLGGHTSGPELADALTTDLRNTDLCRIELGCRVTEIRTGDDHVTVALDTGSPLTAPYAILATGVGPLQPRDAPWITAPPDLAPPPLWQVEPGETEGRTLLVLGGDRPVGTFLRAHPTTATRLLVAYPQDDDYKVEEIQQDPRVTLLPVDHLTLHPRGAAHTAETVGRDGTRKTLTADAVFLSIGSAPTTPPGDLVRDTAGYCPPSHQHPRVLIAGDLRSARYQRIMTAMGSGGEAALHAYYAAREMLGTD